MSELYRIAYCSRSCLTGTSEEIEAKIRQILAAARVSNRKHDLTGALTFNQSYFAQVLDTRSFPNWSMAYVAKSDGTMGHPLAHFEFEAALTDGATPEGKKLLSALRRVVGGRIDEPVVD